MSRSCVETNSEGKPCGMKPLKGSDRCWNHDPSRARDRSAARKEGGRRRKRVGPAADGEDIDLSSIEGIRDLLMRATQNAFASDSGIQQVRALTYIAGQATKLLEVGEIERRLEELESRLQGAEERRST